mgnify:CR=1 FL=1
MSLSPYTSELGVSKAKHLLRRSCFHYNKTLLYQISSLNVDQALDLLFSDNTIESDFVELLLELILVVKISS